MRKNRCIALLSIIVSITPIVQLQAQDKNENLSFEQYIRNSVLTKSEIDVFVDPQQHSWAQYDAELGYILGNDLLPGAIDKSKYISTVRSDGARAMHMYENLPCRINTYGNSFTQCHQVNDAETWREYLAGHLGEPIRNFGMGGFGVHQAYRRMLREEGTENAAKYIMLYIWGDDHIRTLLRCRYALTKQWRITQDEKEGVGTMFHGNFWPNIEMNMKTGMLEEHESRIRTPDKLYQMTDPDWMWENLKDDMALQMYLCKQEKITDIDLRKMKQLAGYLDTEFNSDAENLQTEIGKLLNRYAYAATRYILQKTREFANENSKKLMLVLFDPYGAMQQLLKGEPRIDQEIVDFLEKSDFNYFDMNLVHVEDYYKRYFIGHYNPRGNHFFAYSIKPRVVEWLNPKPFTYQVGDSQSIDFNGYLEGMDKIEN